MTATAAPPRRRAVAPPRAQPVAPPQNPRIAAANRLQADCAAVRVRFSWWGTSKALDDDIKSDIAESYAADAASLTAGKKLFDTKDPGYRGLSRVKKSEHLAERLKPNPDGTRKVFRDSAVENFQQFFRQFRELNVRSSPDLDALVTRAESLVSGQDADHLRTSADARAALAASLDQVTRGVDALLTAPRRRAWQPRAPASATPASATPDATPTTE